MSAARVIVLTSVALLAFAANSLLCRLALKQTSIDAASFTTIRIVAGAAVLWLVTHVRGRVAVARELAIVVGTLCLCRQLFFCICERAGIGRRAAALRSCASDDGRLCDVVGRATPQATNVWAGDALAGLVGLLLPGLSAPPLLGSVLMISAGVAWGIYSLRGKGAVIARHHGRQLSASYTRHASAERSHVPAC